MLLDNLFLMTDNIYKIGSSKDICEDYSYSSYEGFMALSDGTSNSSFTDLGARLLVNKKIDYIRKNESHEDTQVLMDCLEITSKLNLSKYSLASTLSYASVSGDSYNVGIIGDGILVCRRRETKVLEIWNFKFSDDSPYYLIYEADEIAKKSWLKKFDPKLVRELNVIYPDGSLDPETYIEITDIDSDFKGVEYAPSLESYDCVILLSDGIHSFHDKEDNSISYLQVISEMFRNIEFTDDYINRSYSKYLARHKSYRHTEDLAISAINTSY